MNKARATIATICAAFALCIGLVGCGASNNGLEVGINEESAQDIVTVNGLGQDLVMLGYGGEGYSAEYDISETPLAPDAECHFFIEDMTGEEFATVIAADADGTRYEAPGVPFTTIASMRLVSEDDIVYVEFVDVEGNEGTTKDASLEYKAQLEKEEADIAAADAVFELSEAIPPVEEIGPDDEAAIAAARAAYDALTDDQKAKFGAEAALGTIEAAEAALQAAKGADDQQVANEGAAAGSDSYAYDSDDYSEPAQSEESCLDQPVIRN